MPNQPNQNPTSGLPLTIVYSPIGNPTYQQLGFTANEPYGDYYTYTSYASPLLDYNLNPTEKNPRQLNLSKPYTSPIGPDYKGILDAEYINQWTTLTVSSASYSTPAGVELYGTAAVTNQAGILYTNRNPPRAGQGLINQAVRSAFTIAGFPSLTPFSGKFLEAAGNQMPLYATTPFISLNNKVEALGGLTLPYLDFRARKTALGSDSNNKQLALTLIDRRYDGASAALRGSGFASALAIASTTTGYYPFFNLDTVYGWGQQDDPNAIRNDYTLRSSIATRINDTKNIYKKVLGGFEAAIPFRGDRVNAVDFRKRTWNSIYQWADTDLVNEDSKLNKLRKWTANVADILGVNPYGTTKDFIKFFFTGPELYNGGINSNDYALVFRAILTSFSDQFSPSWSPINLVGRADPNYQYGGVTRDIDLGFTVYATDRDELRFLYRKLNYLASYTAPTYNTKSLSVVPPWIRVTVGDLLVSQAAVINSVSYTFGDADSTWEINFEEDLEMMQVPHKVDVSLGLHLIGNQIPEQFGSMYTLSKKFDENGVAVGDNPGTNWLYDSVTVDRSKANKAAKDAANAAAKAAKDAAEAEAKKQAADAVNLNSSQPEDFLDLLPG